MTNTKLDTINIENKDDIYYLDDLNFQDKTVIIRVDYNVPIKDNKVQDSTRIIKSLETIKFLQGKAKKIILMTHLGRPQGYDSTLRLDIVAKQLQEVLKNNNISLDVVKLDDCIGNLVKNKIAQTKNNDIVLLENLRFYSQEKENDEIFSKELASLADIYVNDAFGTSHRAHSSTHGITKFISECCAGRLLEKEIKSLSRIISNPKKPFISIIGCAKIKDKLGAIKSLLKNSDYVLFGGAIVFSFLKLKGLEIGKSYYEENTQIITELINNYDSKIILPTDFIVTSDLKKQTQIQTVAFDKIPKDSLGVDIGPESVKLFLSKIKTAKTICWNGPMGVFEIPPFDNATNEIAQTISQMKNQAFSVIGGGDTVSSIKKYDHNLFGHISTGGGAFLEFVEGRILPGIQVLKKK